MASKRCPLNPTRSHSSYFAYQANGRITAFAPQCSALCTKCEEFEKRWHRRKSSSGKDSEIRLSAEKSALQGLKHFDLSTTSARKVKSNYANMDVVACSRWKSFEQSVPTSRRASVRTKRYLLPIPLQAESCGGVARRRRLLLKFSSVRGRNRYAQLMDQIESSRKKGNLQRKSTGKLRIKWTINFVKGTIRTRYSISQCPPRKI